MRIVYKGCPLCDSTNIEFERSGDCSAHPLYSDQIPPEIRWMKCYECSHSFAEGYFSNQAQEILFSNINPSQLPGSGNVYWQRTVSSRIVEKLITSGVTSGGRWLDVGFGNGALLATAQEYGFDVFGLDARQQAVDAIKGYGVAAASTPFSEYRSAVKYDVISMADVLEHMPFPRDVLLHAKELLTSSGKLFLSMPNSDAFVWRFKNKTKANPYWNELEHYHNFGRERLESLLRDYGFKILSYGISERYYMCMEVIAFIDD